MLQRLMAQAVDGYEAWRLRLITEGPPPRAAPPGSPVIYYLLETTAPDSWIPLVQVCSPGGDLYFRRGVVERPRRPGRFRSWPAT